LRRKSQLTALDHLILSIFPGNGKGGVMSFLTVHFDDSGTHLDSPIAIAACYAAKIERWKKFERKWNRAKAQFNFETFHMADFAANRKEFCKWGKSKQRKVLKHLCWIVNSSVEFGFAVAVPKSIYDAVITGPFKKLFVGDFHYTFAVRSCADYLARWRRAERAKSSMKYIFDQMGSNHGKGEIMRVMDAAIASSKREAKKTGIAPLTGYAFEDKAVTLPLQASDIFAWTVFKQIRKIFLHENPGWIADLSWERISSFDGPFRAAFFTTKEELQTWADRYLDALIALAERNRKPQ
jgi:Protein of unknown function (DUF3800)